MTPLPFWAILALAIIVGALAIDYFREDPDGGPPDPPDPFSVPDMGGTPDMGGKPDPCDPDAPTSDE